MDARLCDLIVAIEAGQAHPRVITLLTGSWLLQGEPVSTERFRQVSHDSLYNSVAKRREIRKFRGTDKERSELVLDVTNPIVAALERAGREDNATLNLIEVAIAGQSGPSLHPPAVRVPVSAVTAWWITDFETKKSGSGGGAFFVGFDV